MSHQFSVIIPLFNKGPYIERAVHSVLQQSLKNFEIIIVDDGSTDNGAEIVKKISDHRICVVSQQNKGVSAARNTGALRARSLYLAFLDADDTWQPEFLQRVADLIEEYPSAGIYGTSNFFIYPNGKRVSENFSDIFEGKKTGIISDYFGLFAKIRKSPFSNSNLCIPKAVFEWAGGYREGVRLTEDSDLWCRIALKYQVAFDSSPLATYYLAVPGSTQDTFHPREYQVVTTLKEALQSGEVNPVVAGSVRKLIAFKQLALVKRAIMAGKRNFALSYLFKIRNLYYYPIEVLQCVVSLLLPHKVFLWIKETKIER